MGAQLGGSGAMSEINMTPLIDIVLVVLIIMMVNMPVTIERMGVKLPAEVKDPPPPPKEPTEQLVVMMYEDGRLALSKRLISNERLFEELTLRLKSMSKKVVFIDAWPDLIYGDVIEMVDLAKQAGAEKVSFARLKEDGPPQPTSADSGALPRGIHPGSPSVAGAMTEKQAYDQFAPMLPAIDACYRTTLATAPSTRGRITFLVDVGPDGEVMDSGIIDDTIDDEALRTCILEKLPALEYEALGEQNTARIYYPILFSAG